MIGIRAAHKLRKGISKDITMAGENYTQEQIEAMFASAAQNVPAP